MDACTEAEAQRTAAEKANQQATWEASRREEAEQRARALERTVDELTTENHRLTAELEALRQTRLFRWTALPRGVYHGIRTRLLSPRRRRPS